MNRKITGLLPITIMGVICHATCLSQEQRKINVLSTRNPNLYLLSFKRHLFSKILNVLLLIFRIFCIFAMSFSDDYYRSI